MITAAIMQVLRSAHTEMRARDIHAATQVALGGRVSRHTVSDFLITHSGRVGGSVERVRHGHYRIRDPG